MSDHEPASKYDLQESETRLTVAIREIETNLSATFAEKLHDTEQRLGTYARQAAEDAETRVVRAFMGIAEAQASRSRELELSRERMLERLAATEGRLLELEDCLTPSRRRPQKVVCRLDGRLLLPAKGSVTLEYTIDYRSSRLLNKPGMSAGRGTRSTSRPAAVALATPASESSTARAFSTPSRRIASR